MKSFIAIALFSLAVATPLQPRQNNLQPFTGALGGVSATPVTNSGNPKRPFQVKGDTFVNIAAALQRSCDQQFNACASKANGGDKTLSVNQCSQQKNQCTAADQGVKANGNATATASASNGKNNTTAIASNSRNNTTASASNNRNNATANAGNSKHNTTASAGKGKKNTKVSKGCAL